MTERTNGHLIEEEALPMISRNGKDAFKNTCKLFPKRPALDLSFKNITYTVKIWHRFSRPVDKEILHGVSGEFKSGEMTALLGPSGAGKSTLLNILAGYTERGAGGAVLINGEDRRIAGMRKFLRLSCYIQQDDALRPFLTAHEAMLIASHLKLGVRIPLHKKKERMYELLDMLGLTPHAQTMTKMLSGGQKKRLSIALELISNPPIIFLDEPTSGLDSSSCFQCVRLLKCLAEQGRTVITTIHQPSALIFECFDHIYAVAEGSCIYQGSGQAVVPYFSQFDLHCPPYHNPADFLIEVTTGEYTADTVKLAAAAACRGRQTIALGKTSVELTKTRNPPLSSEEVKEFVKYRSKSPPAILQAYYLFWRNVISFKRNKSNLLLRLSAHLAIAIIFGYLYEGVGDNANKILANSVFLYGSNLFLIYTGQMAVILAFPLELEMLRREHFNRWFSLGPYLFSLLSVEIPFQVLCCLIYLIPSYVFTGQPLELFRLAAFVMVGTITSLTAQSSGFFFGVTMPVSISVFVGPVLMVLLSVFGFAIRLRDIPFTFVWLHYLSFVRASYQSLITFMYGLKRDMLYCPEGTTYCHFADPMRFLEEMDLVEFNVLPEILYVGFVGITVYLTTAFCIWHRLNNR